MTSSAEPLALVVDDQAQMLSIVSFALETQGFRCLTARNAERAWELFNQQHIDIMVLDIMLPGASGISLCERVRSVSTTPVILLTAKNATEDRIKGLMAGADDYLTKPFSPRELALRAQAVFRRSSPASDETTLVNGELTVNTAVRAAFWRGRNLHLPDLELRLLTALMRRKGEVTSWAVLLNDVWFTSSEVGSRAMIKTTIYRLRQRLEGEGAALILTVRGEGYLMPDAGNPQ